MSNRIIKFRAWDGKNKKFIKDGFIVTENGTVKVWDGSGWGENQYHKEFGIVLMQFTGLKDKNGKEIYEGDVVKNNDQNWQIYYGSGAYRIRQVGKDYKDGDHLLCLEYQYCEVIGNVMENPELLSAPKE